MLTAQCVDAECGWKWEGADRHARDRAAAHVEMYDHEIVYAESPDSTTEASGAAVCRVCGVPAASRGRYAYTCPLHRDVDKAAGLKKSAPKRTKPVAPRKHSAMSLDALTEEARRTRAAALTAYEAWEAAAETVRQELSA